MMSQNYNIMAKMLSEQNGCILLQDLLQILDAYQIASGQEFAASKTHALLDYLKKNSQIIVMNSDSQISIQSEIQLEQFLAKFDSTFRISSLKG